MCMGASESNVAASILDCQFFEVRSGSHGGAWRPQFRPLDPHVGGGMVVDNVSLGLLVSS